jgi:shikimate kinase
MNLFLIGYRCTGKTTIGKSIAATIDWSFVDSDLLVIKECKKNIKDIIDTQGWQAFRRVERSMIKKVCTKDRQVVATGGGAVLDTYNVRAMESSGIIVWLRATAETIRERMLQDETTRTLRPALSEKGSVVEIEEVLLARHPYYENACDFAIPTDNVPVNEITKRIIQDMKNKKGA